MLRVKTSARDDNNKGRELAFIVSGFKATFESGS